ncbi:amino acid adenylation domain-containing protein, partial [Mucilaginibacter sp. SG538B]|uniref:non-ribosomal peptide synthetase n=1 Tax=Mucilaginibacter sp. SG538B TaxID=2587021 RepID=UPI00159CFD49
PLLRVAIYQLADDRWLFTYVMHHIISDGWSMNIFISELTQVYNTNFVGTPNKFPDLPIQYKDYSVWQQAELNKGILQAQRDYWLSQFDHLIPVLDLPTDRKRPPVKTFKGGTITKRIPSQITEPFKSLTQELGGTLFMGLLSVVNALLYKYTNKEDIIIGTPISGREHADLEQQIGLFINTVALRTRFQAKKSFTELFAQAKRTSLKAYENQLYPFDELVDDLNLKRDLSKNLLFDVMIVMQHSALKDPLKILEQSKHVRITKYEGYKRNVSKYDLTFYFQEDPEGLLTTLEFNTDIFDSDTAIKISDDLAELMGAITVSADSSVERLIKKLEHDKGQLKVTLEPVTIEMMECTEHQKRLWFIDEFEKNNLYENSPVYHNLSLAVKFDTALNAAKLEVAITKVVQNNSALRTRIKNDSGFPYQQICDCGIINLKTHSDCSPEKIGEYILSLIQVPFELSSDSLIRFDNVYCDGGTIFLITAHHIILDRASLRIVFEEILANYYKPETATDKQAIGSYRDFSKWQNNLNKIDLSPLTSYWRRKLKNAPILVLETDKQRAPIHVYKYGLKERRVDADLSNAIRAFCKFSNKTELSIFLAAFNVLLYRLTGSEEIVIGTVADRRENPALRNIVGPIVNLITLKNSVKVDLPFVSLAEHIRSEYEESRDFSGIPFESVVLEVNPEKDMSRTALFDILFSYEEDALRDFEIIELNHGLGKYDINLLIKKTDEYGIYLTYNSIYFEEDTIDRFLDHYFNLITDCISSREKKVSELDIFNPSQKSALLHYLDNTESNYPFQKTITSLFEEQARMTPDADCVVYEGTRLTYNELNELSNQLAFYLRNTYDIQNDDLIGIKLNRSEWLVIAILAVLKAGAAYVPVDPHYPQERIDHILTASSCKCVIDDYELRKFKTQQMHQPVINPGVSNDPASLAYVIFTSGTTGKPKGTLVEHGNVVRLLKNDKQLFDFSEKDVWTMFHSFCFDFSVWELFGALLNGGKLIVVPDELTRDPALFFDLLLREKATILNQTPSAFYNLLDELSGRDTIDLSLRYVIFGGEALSPVKLKPWAEKYPKTKLVNMYGITETTVHVTYKDINIEDILSNSSSIGKPIPTLSAYILDNQLNPVPQGVFGELYVGGAGVARGYLNAPALTAEKFIPNPFKAGRLYRTGDKVKLSSTGELLYGGRMDDQVKIRGYRIELKEIELALESHKNIVSAIVVLRVGRNTENELVAYVVGRKNLNTKEIKNYLGKSLPSYMIPGYFVQLEKLPLTSNGKIDKAKLPNPESHAMVTGVKYAAPENDTERLLVEIWKELLLIEQIGINDNFFDLGGHSLKATKLVSEIHKVFNIKLKLEDIFSNTTLHDLSTEILNKQWLNAEDQIQGSESHIIII